MALGVNPIDTSLMQQGMKMQSQLLQNLGAQLRQDVQVIQTNRQLQGLAQNIQSIDPNSPDFAPKLVGLMSQYPMAAQSPIGQAAINTLGAQHKAYLQQQAQSQNLYTPISGTNAILNKRTGETLQLPEGSRPSKPIQVGRSTVALYDPATGEAKRVDEFGLPLPVMADPFEMEDKKQAGREALLNRRLESQPSREDAIAMQGANTRLNKAMELYMKAEADASRLEALWNKMSDGPDKWKLGDEASAARAQAESIKRQVEQASSQLKGVVPASPATIDGMPQAGAASVGHEALISPELTEPSISPASKRRVFNPATGRIE